MKPTIIDCWSRPVGAGRSLAVVVSRVGVGAGPLEVDVISLGHLQRVGDKVVLDGRVHLYYVASLPADVDVVDLCVFGNSVVFARFNLGISLC